MQYDFAKMLVLRYSFLVLYFFHYIVINMLQNINVRFFSPPYYFYYLFTFCIYAIFLLVVSYPNYFFLNIFYHTCPVYLYALNVLVSLFV